MDNKTNIYDYIVIGAGIAGITYSYTNKSDNFVILERNDYIGGRICNISWHDEQISLGAGVILNDNTYTLDLCKKFGFELGEFTSVYHLPDLKGDPPNGPKYYSNNNIIFKYLKNKYAENKDEISRLKLSFRDFLYYYLPFAAANTILLNALYSSSLDGDVDYLLTTEFSYDILRTHDENMFYIKSGGYNKLLDKLIELIGKSNIKLSSSVKYIDYLEDKQIYQISLNSDEKYLTKKVVMATDFNSSIKFNVQSGLTDLINKCYSSIGSVEYIRIYSFHKDGHGLANAIKLEGLTGKTMIMSKNILMLCYTEGVNANLLNNSIKDLEKQDQIDFIYKLFQNHNIDISKPDDIYIKFWQVGMHYPKPNCSNLSEQLDQMKQYNFEMIGEAVARTHGWVNSAISTVL